MPKTRSKIWPEYSFQDQVEKIGNLIKSQIRTIPSQPFFSSGGSETHIQRKDRKKAPIKGKMSSRSPIKRLNVKLLYVSCAMRGEWHRQSMQGGLTAYAFIGISGLSVWAPGIRFQGRVQFMHNSDSGLWNACDREAYGMGNASSSPLGEPDEHSPLVRP